MRTIAVTLGDPAGIGPEIVAKALADLDLPGARFVVVGGEKTLLAGAQKTGVRLEIDGARLSFRPVEPYPDAAFGKPSPATGSAALATIDLAVTLALNREVDAIVTAPVSKRHIAECGASFTGHTEHLAARAHVRHPVMMFVADRLRVSLVTTHLALKKVPSAITTDRVAATIRETDAGLRGFFGILEPRIAVAGLNPHAGEGGHFGREEAEVITPAIEQVRKAGVKVAGPFPADTLFRRAMAGEFDAVVAMYHDQALGPVKTVSTDAVNVTLGLPFIRTSVDHGTAFDIAGQGKADAAPMIRAIRLAHEMLSADRKLL